MRAYIHFGFAQHFDEDLLADVRFVVPAQALRETGQIVFRTHAEIELLRIAADDFLLAKSVRDNPPVAIPPR